MPIPSQGSLSSHRGEGTPSSQPKISVWVLLPRVMLCVVEWIMEHFGIKIYEMFRARTKDRERKGSRRYGNEHM